MSLLKTYPRDVAAIMVSEIESRGWQFRPGVFAAVEKAVSDATADGVVAIAASVERVLLSMRISINPRWDGSIA